MSNAPSVSDPVQALWIDRFTTDLTGVLTAIGRGRITTTGPAALVFERHAVSVTPSEADAKRLTVVVTELGRFARGAPAKVARFPATVGDDTYAVARRVAAWLMPRVR